VSEKSQRISDLEMIYHAFLADQDVTAFVKKVSRRYSAGTLERVAQGAARLPRRAAVMALGFLGDYDCNAVLGRALADEDRGVRLLAETSLRSVWCRYATENDRQHLGAVIRLNTGQHFAEAIRWATELITRVPAFAEAWNQRAIAYFSTGRYVESIRDCRQTVELNPYHFGAVAGMGQCYLQLGNQLWALESFRRALAINPNLEGIRGNITSLERRLKKGTQ
jgi:tetratricopeptide (TPR) repeat protein